MLKNFLRISFFWLAMFGTLMIQTQLSYCGQGSSKQISEEDREEAVKKALAMRAAVEAKKKLDELPVYEQSRADSEYAKMQESKKAPALAQDQDISRCRALRISALNDSVRNLWVDGSYREIHLPNGHTAWGGSVGPMTKDAELTPTFILRRTGTLQNDFWNSCDTCDKILLSK